MFQPPFEEWLNAVGQTDSQEQLTFPVPSGHLGRGFGHTRTGELRFRQHRGIDIGGEESSAPTARAAARTSSAVASGRPKAMFSPIVPLNRKASWGTMPICERSEWRGDVAQVVAVDQHAPGGRVVEARDELGQRRLAGAGGADQRDGLPGRHAQRHVVQRVRAVAVGEGHAVEHDLAAQARQVDARPARRPGRAPRRAARRSCPAPPSPTGRSCRAGRAAGSGRRSCSARPGRRRARRS